MSSNKLGDKMSYLTAPKGKRVYIYFKWPHWLETKVCDKSSFVKTDKSELE